MNGRWLARFEWRTVQFRVLMVCSGNICRSPLAAAVLAARRASKVTSVESAGIGALIGSSAHPDATRVAKLHGLELAAHRARQFDQALGQRHDLILVMEMYQRLWIERAHPSLCGRIHLLGKWRRLEIADPFGRGPIAFDVAMEEILLSIDDWRARLG